MSFSFLFTDIEGSTRRWESHPDEMRAALARHDALVRAAVTRSGGRVFKAIGDAFCAVYPAPAKALDGALAIQRALAAETWGAPGPLRVRAAIHTGAAEERDDDYFGPALNRVARLLSAGHGGQTLLSRAAADAVADALPTGVSLRDLGERRLKDLARPERIFQAAAEDLPGDFPPLRTLDARPNNLPAQATSLVGREAELAQVRALLRRDGVRLVTLSGPGGTGKTRLALQAVAEMADEFAHGVWFVPLAPIRDPELVLPAVAAALDVKDAPGVSPADALKEFLRERRLLLILDNFEQVLDAGPSAAELLAAAPGLKILVTSRGLLRVYGEHDFPVPPLTLPCAGKSLSECNQSEAVRLFAERARAVKPSFAVTDENAPALAALTAQLDGLPLAIELAAAQIRMFTPEAMLAELCVACGGGGSLELLSGGARNLPERQRTLRGAIAWSYDLLDEDERAAFRRLGVFSGGWDRGGAAVVLDKNRSQAALQSLLDKSLLRVCDEGGEPRFEMLETLREFALERLDERGEGDDARARHSAHFLSLAETCSSRLEGPDQQRWSERLAREFDNFRAALARALARKDADAALRFAANLGPLWNQRGRYSEGRVQLEAALGMGVASPSKTRARAILSLGQFHNGLGDLPQARLQLEKALELFRSLGDRGGAVDALTTLSWVRMYQGDLDGAEKLTAELLDESQRLGEPRRRALALERAAYVAQERGRPERAVPLLEEALVLMRRAEDKLGVALLLNVLGEHTRPSGDFARALGYYRESFSLSSELGNAFWRAVAEMNVAVCLMRLGRPAEALPLMSESLTAAYGIGNKRNVPPALIAFAALAAMGGKPEPAAVLLGAAEKFLREQNTVLVYADRGEQEETLRAVRALMDRAAYESALASGRTLSLDAAVAKALELADALEFGAANRAATN
ncbi:MAG: ATP-binding protein [Elusimicrobiota bacterium]